MVAPFESCQPSNTRGLGPWLHTVDWITSNNRKFSTEKHSWYYGRTTELCRDNKSFVFAHSETATCVESCIIQFPTRPPFSTVVDVLETGDVPILFSRPRMRNLGMTIELDPQGIKITCSTFGLYSSPAEYSTMGHIVLDLTRLTYQPTTKSNDRLGNPKRHVTFAISERNRAYPARTQPYLKMKVMDLWYSPIMPLSLMMKMLNLFAPPASGKELSEERRDQTTDDGDLAHLVPPRPSPIAPLRRRKRATCMARIATLEEVTRNSRERTDDVSTLSKKSEGETLQNIINKLSDVHNLNDIHLKHYHMSTVQFQRRTTHLDIPGKVYVFCQHVVKTCPFCNSIEPRPESSRMSGLRAEEFVDLIFLDHGSAKIGDKTFGFLIVLDGATSHLTAHPCKSTSPSKVFSKLHEWMDTFQMNPRRFVLTWPSINLMTCKHSIACTT